MARSIGDKKNNSKILGRFHVKPEAVGVPRFTIVTVHKPLLPLFNKPTAKLPPRKEKCFMDMQDVDFETKYEPERDEADPLFFVKTPSANHW